MSSPSSPHFIIPLHGVGTITFVPLRLGCTSLPAPINPFPFLFSSLLSCHLSSVFSLSFTLPFSLPTSFPLPTSLDMPYLPCRAYHRYHHNARHSLYICLRLPTTTTTTTIHNLDTPPLNLLPVSYVKSWQPHPFPTPPSTHPPHHRLHDCATSCADYLEIPASTESSTLCDEAKATFPKGTRRIGPGHSINCISMSQENWPYLWSSGWLNSRGKDIASFPPPYVEDNLSYNTPFDTIKI